MGTSPRTPTSPCELPPLPAAQPCRPRLLPHQADPEVGRAGALWGSPPTPGFLGSPAEQLCPCSEPPAGAGRGRLGGGRQRAQLPGILAGQRAEPRLGLGQQIRQRQPLRGQPGAEPWGRQVRGARGPPLPRGCAGCIPSSAALVFHTADPECPRRCWLCSAWGVCPASCSGWVSLSVRGCAGTPGGVSRWPLSPQGVSPAGWMLTARVTAGGS